MAMFTFDAPWESWEVHPNGHEVVICTAGVWHTADVSGQATCVLITAGAGTQGRPRRT